MTSSPPPPSRHGAPRTTIKPLQTLVATPDERTWYLSFAPSSSSSAGTATGANKLVATCGADKTVRMFRGGNEAGGKWEPSVQLEDGHSRTIRMCEFSPDGSRLATCSFDGTTVIWTNTNMGGGWTPIRTLQGHENEVKGLAWNANGSLLATCGRDKKVWIWTVPDLSQDNNTRRTHDDDDDHDQDNDEEMIVDASLVEWECAAILTGHQGDVKRVCFHPTQDLLASASYDDTIRLWARDPVIQDWVCVSTLTGHTNTVWDCKFIQGQAMDVLVSCSQDLTVKVWVRHNQLDNSTTTSGGKPVAQQHQELFVDKMEDVDDAAVLAALDGGRGDGMETEGIGAQRMQWTLASTCTTPHWRTIYSLDWCDGMLLTCGGDDSVVLYEFNPDTSLDVRVVNVMEKAHDMDVNCVRFMKRDEGNKALSSSSSSSGTTSMNKVKYVFGTVGDDGFLRLFEID